MSFAQWLQSKIDLHGFTNYRIAKMAGVHQSTVAHWLMGAKPQAEKESLIRQAISEYEKSLSGSSDESIKKTAVPQDDGHTDYVDIASRRIRCARPISILAVQYGVPTYLMQQIIGCDFNRAEGLCVGRYEPIEAELRKVSETFCIPYDELIQGWVPLSANPDVFSRIALYTSYPSPSQEGQE